MMNEHAPDEQHNTAAAAHHPHHPHHPPAVVDSDDDDDDSHSNNNNNSADNSLLCCAFNQDGGCLAIGTTNGFSIYNLSPFQCSVSRQLPGGIGHVEMLFRCNLLALVGGGPSPYAPPHRVLIWDDHSQKAIGELSFRQVVLSTKLRRDAIAVALRDRVYVYHLADLSLRDKIYTSDNPYGLLCLSTAVQDMVLACPSVTQGHVRVELYALRKTVLMEAHESSLHALALSADGTRLATASVKGTVIRVWNVTSQQCLQEFRRGVERATITCLAWSFHGDYLGCTSDKGTAHVFGLPGDTSSSQQAHPGHSTASKNKKNDSSLTKRFYHKVRQSIEGETKKSISQIRGIPHPQACAFLPHQPNCLVVAGWDIDGNGVVLKAEFTPNSEEESKRVGYHVVAKSAYSRQQDESDATKRRRRLMGVSPGGMLPASHDTPEQTGRLYVGERLEVLEGMKNLVFEEESESGFVSVSTMAASRKAAPRSSLEEPKKEKRTPTASSGEHGANSVDPTTSMPATTTTAVPVQSPQNGDKDNTPPKENNDGDESEMADAREEEHVDEET